MALELSRPASFWQLCVPASEGGGNWGQRRHSCPLLLLRGVRGMAGDVLWGLGRAADTLCVSSES